MNEAKVWMSSFQKKETCLVFNVLWHFQDTGIDTLTYLGDPTKMVNLLMDHTHLTQAYIKTAIKEQCKLYDSYDHWNDCGACYAKLDSLDATFKMYIKAHLPNNSCFLLIWMQVIKALQSDSLKCFKAMK